MPQNSKPEDQGRKPRYKDKKVKNANASRIKQFDLNDLARITSDVPDEIKIAIADAIMAFSNMEMAADNFIWDLLGLSVDDGKLAIQLETKAKLELAKKLSERYGIPIHKDAEMAKMFWTNMRLCVEARNKMAHGVWQMLDGKIPLVVSYRIPTEAGHVNSEHFPKERIRSVEDACKKLKMRLDIMCQHIASLPSKPQPLPQEKTTEHPLYPEYGTQ